MKVRKLPIVVDAEQIPPQGEEFGDLAWTAMHLGRATPLEDGRLSIETMEGTVVGRPGDWLIRGVNGEFYPCEPDVFAKTYETAESGELAIGDVVRLAHGGPAMTVIGLPREGIVHCGWFTDRGEPAALHVPAAALRRVEPAKPPSLRMAWS